MAKIYFEDTKLIAARNKIFADLNHASQINIFDVVKLSSGDYLPTQQMVEGEFSVYGGGGSTDKKHNKYNVEFETLGIGRVGARCGCVFQIKPKSWVTDNALFASQIDNQFDIDFLIHFLNHKNINQLANTAAQPVISLKRMANISIPKIEITLQREIVEILDKIENGVFEVINDKYGIGKTLNFVNSNENLENELTHQLDLVKQLRQSFLREAMQGKLINTPLPIRRGDGGEVETGQQLLAKIKAEKAQLIAAKKLKKEKDLPPIKPEDIPFEIPEHWTWCRLGEVCTKIGSGSTPKGSNYSKEGKPFFRSQNIYNQGLVYDDISFISDDVHQQMNGTTVYPNDILLNITGGSMGRCAIVPKDFDEGNVSQHVCIIRPLTVDNQYLHKLILSPDFQKLIFSSTTGAGREGLPKYNLERFPIPLPPLSEQRRIVEKLESLMQTCDALEASIKDSQGQNQQLLQQVLREALRK